MSHDPLGQPAPSPPAAEGESPSRPPAGDNAVPEPLAPLSHVPLPSPAWTPAPAAPQRVFPNLRQSLLLLVIFFTVTTATAWVTLGFLRVEHALSEPHRILLAMVVGETLGVWAGFRLARWPLRRVFANLGFSTRTLRWLLVIGFGNLLVVGSLLFIVAALFGPFRDDFFTDLFTVSSPAEFLVLLLAVAVAAPVLEELLVRGIILRGLTWHWGIRGGVLLSALLFSVIHMNPLQAGPTFVNGVVWAIVLLKTGSLGTTLFLHAFNNSLVFLFAQIAQLGSGHLARAGGSESPAIGPLEIATVVAIGLVGVSMVLAAVAGLPKAPWRLTALWGVDVSQSPKVAGRASDAATH